MRAPDRSATRPRGRCSCGWRIWGSTTSTRDPTSREVQWTFSTERKFMATLGVSAVTGKRVLYVKGAPELVLARCTSHMGSDGLTAIEPHQQVIQDELLAFQKRGMRTLALGYKEFSGHDEEARVDVASDLVWLGFVAIADPIRVEVPAAVAACRKAGVKLKMVTGDNVETAVEIARQIGLMDGSEGAGDHDGSSVRGAERRRGVEGGRRAAGARARAPHAQAASGGDLEGRWARRRGHG